MMKKIINFLLILTISFSTLSCGGLKKVDQRSRPTDPEERRRQAVNEGRGTGINDLFRKGGKGTNFEFASSNELWRASLDAIDFMPLVSVNYSGGLIITDWYSGGQNSNENIKISIRFLTNEIRSDALDIKIFKKNCTEINKCTITLQDNSEITKELKKKILKTAKIYEVQKKDKNFKPYETTSLGN